MFESAIRINNLGFRGRDIELEKGGAYRIVALGESTTFGCTITEDGKPWPLVLEELFAQRLKTARPVQVINAGVYGYTIERNLGRLEKQILPLQPDMIISYHGYNFFSSLNSAIPPPEGQAAPPYVFRPLKLLADLEYRIKISRYQRSRAPQAPSGGATMADPMSSKYAEAYEELIHAARQRGIRLAIANYSMAVNPSSNPEVVDFYRAAFPEVRAEIEANRAHSGMVVELGRRHPEILVINTHPDLDGRHEKFIDLVHFTQEGRDDLAETIYRAIVGAVAEDLAAPVAEEVGSYR